MADNVTVTPGSGATVAADVVGGVLFQRVKATWGPDGTANDTDVATGKSLPIQVRSATGLIPLGEPTDAKSTATDTTSVTAISIWKQISASIQAAASALAGTLTVATHAVTQSGTWTVQPGNTANTTAWKVDGSAVTQPTKPASVTLVTLDVKTVTTGGTPVTALTSGHRTAGGWIKNPETATVNLGINEIGTAAGTSSDGNTTFIEPGGTYVLAPAAGAVSVISSDSAHPFSGMGYT